MLKALAVIYFILLALFVAILACIIQALCRIINGMTAIYRHESGNWNVEEVNRFLKECYSIGKELDRFQHDLRKPSKAQKSGSET